MPIFKTAVVQTTATEPLKRHVFSLLLIIPFALLTKSQAQPVTGYWKGKIDKHTVEVKLIKKGDSLTGTSYYYQSPNRFRRYSIKGYFDSRDNSVVWWDDVLLDQKGGMSAKQGVAYRSVADFNCPGGTKMYLTGNAIPLEKDNGDEKPVALEKYTTPVFDDEWNEIIDNYTVGGNDPRLIDSISRLAFSRPTPAPVPSEPAQPTVAVTTPKKQVSVPVSPPAKPTPSAPRPLEPKSIKVPTNEERFVARAKKLIQEIPVKGDSIELHFYDNAEVDGDSIAIFLNNRLLYEHVLLSDKPYTLKLPIASLQSSNELVMVAENLGSIPPNTSLMVAIIDGQRYEARLESTEQSSALIRFVKE